MNIKKTISRITALILITAVIMPFHGCMAVGFFGNTLANVLDGYPIEGYGSVQEYQFDCESYDSVEVGGSFVVRYVNGPSNEFKISTYQNLIDHLSYRVDNGVLKVRFNRNIVSLFSDTPLLTIQTPNLRALRASGGLRMDKSDPIEGDSFNLHVSGGCDVDLELYVKSMTAKVSGAGEITLRGAAEDVDIDISGAGTVDAGAFETKTASIELSGAGNATLNCTDSLFARISGAGVLYYYGDPVIDQRVSGAGSIRRAD